MKSTLCFALAVLVWHTGVALAHERLISPPPRENMEANQKIAPCGDLPRSTTPFQVQAGAALNVTWVQTIHHPGWFRISFRTSDAGDFTQDVLIDKVLSVDNVNDGNAMVQMPNMECDTCTLHLSQIMTDQPDSTFATGYKEYNACADLILTATPVNAPVPPAGGTSTGGGTTGTTGNTVGSTDSTASGTAGGTVNSPGKMPTGGCSAVDPSPFLFLGALGGLAVCRRRWG